MMPASESSNLDKLQAPAVLRELKQWLVWKFEPNPKPGKKDLKVPHYAKSGTKRGWFPGVRGKKIGQGSSEEMPLLVTFEEAKAAAIQRGMEGVGLAMVDGCPVTALDFDHCVKDGAIDPEVERLIIGTYAEISPSGTGVRAFVRGDLGDRSDAHPDDGSFGFETYASSRFVTFTGNMTADTIDFGCENEISQPSPLLLETCEKRFGPKVIRQVSIGKSDKERVGLTDEQIKIVLQYTAIGDYHRWMAIGSALHHETEGEGEWLWDEWSQLGADYEGPDEIRYKWATLGAYTGNEKTFWSVLREAQAQGCPIDVDTASPDEFEALPMPKNGKFRITSDDEFAAQESSLKWLVKGFLPKAMLGVLFGESGAGKSFATLDMCAAISRGLETWNGHRVSAGRVLYVVAEGVSGFRQRIRAYCHQHAVKKIGMDVIYDVTPNLMDVAQVSDLIKEVCEREPYDLIVMDTFAQVTAGANENSGEDVGMALAQCKRLAHRSGAMVLLVHHSGKDASKGSRGHSSIKAACDVELQVERGKDTRSITTSKMKDGMEGLSYIFNLHTVVLGQDEDGDDITSCIVEFKGPGKVVAEDHKKKTGKNELSLLDAIHNVLGLSDHKAGVETARVHDEFCAQFDPSKKQNYKNQAFNRAKETLLEKGAIFEENGTLFLHAENAHD
ncbi:DNA repair and recombination protein RadB [compost metagenome]